MILKVCGLGLIFNKNSYLRDPWNVMDFVIILLGYFSAFASSQANITSIRSFRVLRPLRTISSIQGLKTIVSALTAALPLLGDTFLVLIFLTLMYAIAGL